MVALVALLLSQTIYTWTDSKGTAHFTDDPSTVPAGVKATTTEGVELSNITPQKADRPAPAPAAAPVDARAEEDYWRAQFRTVREKIRTLEDDLAVDQKKLDDPSRMPMGGSYYCPPGYVSRYGTGQSSVSVSGNANIPLGNAGNLNLNANLGQSIRQTGFPPYVGTAGYGSCWYQPDGEAARTLDRVERNKSALVRAKEELTDLERRAANAAVPLEWRR